MEFTVQMKQLSENFRLAYPESEYPELLWKPGRPYACLLIDTHQGYFICVPFRSSIRHKNAYFFKESERSKRTQSGLDYSKIAIIDNPTYFSEEPAVIDKDEYNETIRHMDGIVAEVTKYVEEYIQHKTGTAVLHEKAFERKYKFSTLAYFHDILEI